MKQLLLCLLLGLVACGGGESSSSAGSGTPNTGPTGTYSIAGTVTAVGGTGRSGVQLTLSGAASSSTVSDSSGGYAFTALGDGDYVVSATLAGESFSPASAAVTLRGQSRTGVNFTQDAKVYPSTQVIADYMSIRHASIRPDFESTVKGLIFSGSRGGVLYIESGRAYVALVQAFVNDSLAFVGLKSQTMPIDSAAIKGLLSNYAVDDASFAGTYYRSVSWGLSDDGLSTFIAGIKSQTDAIYAMAALSLP